MAYVPQSAFIYNATVRENILCGAPFDQRRYEEAIRASAVGPDIDNMPGDYCSLHILVSSHKKKGASWALHDLIGSYVKPKRSIGMLWRQQPPDGSRS